MKLLCKTQISPLCYFVGGFLICSVLLCLILATRDVFKSLWKEKQSWKLYEKQQDFSLDQMIPGSVYCVTLSHFCGLLEHFMEQS